MNIDVTPEKQELSIAHKRKQFSWEQQEQAEQPENYNNFQSKEVYSPQRLHKLGLSKNDKEFVSNNIDLLCTLL